MSIRHYPLPAKCFAVAAIGAFAFVCAVSCQKDQAAVPGPGAPKVSDGLVAGGPPPIIFWAKGADLPFPDNIPGDIPFGRIHPEGFSINGMGYLCGGDAITSQGQAESMHDLWQYDPSTLAWTQEASIPAADPSSGVNFVIGTSAYLFSGSLTWQYNQVTNSWTSRAGLADMPGTHATAFSINGKGYVGLGQDFFGKDQTAFYQYDPVADSWSFRASFPGTRREGAAGFSVNGKGYVCSGAKVGTNGTSYLSDLWQYNPTSDTWVQKADLPAAGRMFSLGLGTASNGFVLTGSNGTSFFNDCWEYFPSNNSWFNFPNVGGGVRTEAGGFSIGSTLYVAGGTAGADGKKDFWGLSF
jgi:hypothetical protein